MVNHKPRTVNEKAQQGSIIENELSEVAVDDTVDDAVQAITAQINKRDNNPDEC